MHQGKKLHELVKLKKLNHSELAQELGFKGRSGFTRYFKEEILDQEMIVRFSQALGVDPKVFFEAPKAEALPAADITCWQLLAEARQEVINLQKQIIEMSTPNYNAPVRVKQTA